MENLSAVLSAIIWSLTFLVCRFKARHCGVHQSRCDRVRKARDSSQCRVSRSDWNKFWRYTARGGCEEDFGSDNRGDTAGSTRSTGGSGWVGIFLKFKEGFVYNRFLRDSTSWSSYLFWFVGGWWVYRCIGRTFATISSRFPRMWSIGLDYWLDSISREDCMVLSCPLNVPLKHFGKSIWGSLRIPEGQSWILTHSSVQFLCVIQKRAAIPTNHYA